MRKTPLINGEYYHIFNRGAGKCDIFSDKYDAFRFLESLDIFNSVDPIGSIFDLKRHSTRDVGRPVGDKLVNIICYCLNSNHYHLILEQLVDGGISEFIKRLAGGYTKYYNERYKKSGVLFQGKFKSVHIESNKQLLYVSSYVNLNNKVHKKFILSKKHFLDLIPNRSSWNEYITKNNKGLCEKSIVFDQFKNTNDYERFSKNVVDGIKEMRYGDEI